MSKVRIKLQGETPKKSGLRVQTGVRAGDNNTLLGPPVPTGPITFNG